MSTNSYPLYADDSSLREFDATVVRSGPRYVILDKTAFYPEGGGQPNDTGVLSLGGNIVKVLKVKKIGVEIYHYLDANIANSSRVHGVIDWLPRTWNTRRHSAEHLLTGLIEELGEPPKFFSSLDQLEYQSSALSETQIRIIGEKFNKIIDDNVPVRIYYENRMSLDASGDPRKQSFLKKIPINVQQLRMVDIGGYALTFCMGTHVKSTQEIGPLKDLYLEETKKGRKIIHFKLMESFTLPT